MNPPMQNQNNQSPQNPANNMNFQLNNARWPNNIPIPPPIAQQYSYQPSGNSNNQQAPFKQMTQQHPSYNQNQQHVRVISEMTPSDLINFTQPDNINTPMYAPEVLQDSHNPMDITEQQRSDQPGTSSDSVSKNE